MIIILACLVPCRYNLGDKPHPKVQERATVRAWAERRRETTDVMEKNYPCARAQL